MSIRSVQERQTGGRQARPDRAIRLGKFLGFFSIFLFIALGFAVGVLIGRYSVAAKPLQSTGKPPWKYRLPELSGKIDQTYRDTIAQTGLDVAAALDAFPHSHFAVSALALLHYLAHDRIGEEQAWERCLELSPKNARAYSRLVALAQQNADYGRIAELMKRALEHEPGNASHRSMLGSALMYLNRPEEARLELEKCIATGNSEADTYLVLGEVYNQLDRPEKAKRFLALAAELAPYREDALYGMVKVCRKLGDTRAAEEYLARFEQLKSEKPANSGSREGLRDENFVPPHIAEIVTLVGEAYLEHGQLEIAEKQFRRAAEISNEDIESRKLLVQLATNARNWSEALRWTKELRKLEPGNPFHYWNEGILYDRAGMFEDSERVFRDFCRMRPANAEGYWALAALYFQGNRKLNEARSLAERAVELEPNARNYSLLGSIAQKQGDRSTAQVALKRAVELDPENPELTKLYESTVNK